MNEQQKKHVGRISKIKISPLSGSVEISHYGTHKKETITSLDEEAKLVKTLEKFLEEFRAYKDVK